MNNSKTNFKPQLPSSGQQIHNDKPNISSVIWLDNVPSNFKPYPKNSKIGFRNYTWDEIYNYNISKLNHKSLLNFVMSGIFTEGFDKEDLTLGDYTYLGIYRIISTLGSKHKVIYENFKCPHCGDVINPTVQKDQLNFEELKVKTSGKAFLKIKTPIFNEDKCVGHSDELSEIMINIPRVSHWIKMIDNNYDLDDEKKLLALQMEDLSFEEANKILNNLEYNDGLKISKIDNAFYHGLNPYELECYKCHKKTSVELEGVEHLLKPFLEDRPDDSSGVRFE